jgi:hypothetical protein
VLLLLLHHAVALGKFNEGVVTYDEEGEVELDLEKVDFASLMEVRRDAAAYIITQLGLVAVAQCGGLGSEHLACGYVRWWCLLRCRNF